VNGIVGFIQGQAERAVGALRRMTAGQCRVRRDGIVLSAAAGLVPGDIVILEAGEVVPADLRLLEVYTLRMQEAALTGEAEAVTKSAEALLPALCVNTIGRSYASDGPSALPQFLWHPYT
jgi:P-type Ca2+ transporter type 2C